jgi:hypothetical protein
MRGAAEGEVGGVKSEHPATPGIKSEADKAIKERHTLHKQYRVMKRAELERLFADKTHGPELRAFRAWLNRKRDIEPDAFVAYVTTDKWLMSAPPEYRIAALELIDSRIIRIRENAGLDPFDDPLPGNDDDVFRICKRVLTA